MKITFEGETLIDIAKQAGTFVNAIMGVSVVKPGLETEEKRKPGRPPNPGSKKDKERIVDAPISPTVDDPFATEEDEAPTPPKHITKDDLTEALKKISEKHSINKVREVFEKFGVKRLGELDEKRYHELFTYVENLL